MKTHWMLHRYWTLECVVSLRCNLWVKSQNLQTHNLAPLLVCKISSCLPICGVQGLVQQLRLPNLCQNQRWQLIGMQACGTCQVFNCEVLLMCCVDIKQHKLRFSMLYCCTKSQERVKQLMPHLGWNVENEQILWAVGSQRKVKPMCVPLYLFNTSPCVGLNTAPCVCWFKLGGKCSVSTAFCGRDTPEWVVAMELKRMLTVEQKESGGWEVRVWWNQLL